MVRGLGWLELDFLIINCARPIAAGRRLGSTPGADARTIGRIVRASGIGARIGFFTIFDGSAFQ
jgi:hypothetical protein